MSANYFSEAVVLRQRLLWAIATRRQLERWEPLVAAEVHRSMTGRQSDGATVWAAAAEHHFALVAARNLLRALALDPASSVSIDPTLRDELIEGRDLHEHWPDNMPVFNVTPRTAQPRFPSGQRFAARNPNRGPYSWLSWRGSEGALLMPHVPAADVHTLLDAIEAEIIATEARFSDYVPPRAPSPWLEQDGQWWPKPDNAASQDVEPNSAST